MLATIPFEVSGSSCLRSTSKSKSSDNGFENEYFPKMGVDRRTKDSLLGKSKASAQSREFHMEIESRPMLTKAHDLWKPDSSPDRSLGMDKSVAQTNGFSSRTKSGNLTKFEKPLISDKEAAGPGDLKLPLLTAANKESNKKPASQPHRLGFVKIQQQERVEAFKIYKNARKSANITRLKSIGFQARPSTPVDVPDPGIETIETGGRISRPLSRISFPPMDRHLPNDLEITRRFPSRNIRLDQPNEGGRSSSKERYSAPCEKEEIENRPALKVMNFEAAVIPEELRPAPARSPLVPIRNSNNIYTGAGAWNPGNIDKPHNILRPTGGYGKHRASIVPNPGPIGQGLHAEKLPSYLVAPTQQNTTSLRQNYAKNLERNWLKRRHEETTRKKREKTILGWIRSRNVPGKVNFEASFFSSDSETESQDGELMDDCGNAPPSKSGVDFTAIHKRSASLDVLLSDSDLSNEDTEDICIVLKNGQLSNKIVANKMRRKRRKRREQFNDIIKITRDLEIAEKVAASINAPTNRDVDPEYFGGIEGMAGENDLDLAIDEMRYFQDADTSLLAGPMPPELGSLTDRQIRAMRLKLKTKERDYERMEYGDTAYLGGLAAELLAGLKAKEKKASKTKKKKKVSNPGKKVKWNKNDDYNVYERKTPVMATAKEQFIQDFGHWFDSRVDWRLNKERTESQAREDDGEDDGEMTDGELKTDEAMSQEDKEPCSTELALREFDDDDDLLTNLLLDTRRPFERFADLNETNKRNQGEVENTPRAGNVLLEGIVAAKEHFKMMSYEDLKVPVSRRKSDPGLERVNQITFTIPVKKRKSPSRLYGRRRSSVQSSLASRRSSQRSTASNAEEIKVMLARPRRPQTPGLYKVRRRTSISRKNSAISDVSDDNVSIKSYASSRKSTGDGVRKNVSRRNKGRGSCSPEKITTEKKGTSPVKGGLGSRRGSCQSRTNLIGRDASEGDSPDSVTSSQCCRPVEEVEYIIDLDELDVPRPCSARCLGSAEPEINLWDLTKGIDFPAKAIKIQIINRKRRRQRKKRQMLMKQSEVRALQKANKMAECVLYGRLQDAEITDGEGSNSDLSSSDESEEHPTPGELHKPMTFDLDSPFVSAFVAWNTSSRMRLKLSKADLDKEIRNLSSLFWEMKECRYIRWSARDWAIIERLQELELLE